MSLPLRELALYKSVAWGVSAAFVFALPPLVQASWSAWRAWAANDAVFFTVGTVIANLLVTIGGNLLMAPVYASGLPFFERFKLSDKAWPWLARKATERAAFWTFTARSLALVAANNAFVALPGAYSLWFLRSFIGGCSLEADAFPSPLTLVVQLAVCFVLEDTMFYHTHALLHHPSLYPYIHKIHHEYRQPVALASEHAHPLEFLLGNLAPVMAGPVASMALAYVTRRPDLAMHAAALWLWVVARVAVSVDEHCGYGFPWSPVRLLPGGASAGGHDWHHSDTRGMYASQFAFWDAVYGTDAVYKQFLDKKRMSRTARSEGGKGKGE
jgi:sterol desaturase/sphingolipid hydroxylase (fatty acid hydroxylase superfamily)